MTPKPKCVKILCMLSGILIAVRIGCSMLITFFPHQSLAYDPAPIPGQLMLLLLAQDMCLLPLVLLAALHYIQPHFKAIITAVSAPIIYILALVVSSFVNVYGMRLSGLYGGAEMLTQINRMNVFKQMFSILGTAGFVLLCCAAAVDCYAQAHGSHVNSEI